MYSMRIFKDMVAFKNIALLKVELKFKSMLIILSLGQIPLSLKYISLMMSLLMIYEAKDLSLKMFTFDYLK